MTNYLISRSKGKCPQSHHSLQNCAEQVRSAKTESRNWQKWQMIYLFIIIISMQGICNLVLLNTDSQLIILNSTFTVPPVIPENSTGWRGSGNRSAPPQNLMVSLDKTESVKTGSDAGCRQFAFYHNTLNPAILNSYLTRQKS
jgi:hypothetical protein